MRRTTPGSPGLAFALALHRASGASAGNRVLSPWSVSVALATLQSGADGETRLEIETALGHAGAGDALIDSFAATLRQLCASTNAQAEGVERRLANALWCQDGYPLQPPFVETVRHGLSSEVRHLDFAGSPAEAARRVNGWVAEVTRQRIRDLLPGSPDPLTRAVLANAVYFKAAWLFPFEERVTRPEPFRLLDGTRVDVPTMHLGAELRHASEGTLQALEVPYASGGFALVLLLPDPGPLEAAERSITPELLGNLLAGLRERETVLSLPRFHVAPAGVRLRSTLGTVGVRAAFGPRADFSRMSLEPGFAVDDVLHSAFIDVDEKGTEAAAATGMAACGAALGPRPRPLQFRVDRPFLFLLRHQPTGTILFMGRLVDPRK